MEALPCQQLIAYGRQLRHQKFQELDLRSHLLLVAYEQIRSRTDHSKYT